VKGSRLKKTLYAAEQGRADVALRRRQWRRAQPRFDPRRLVFIDETWVKTNMTPIRGWARRGERLIARAPFGKWRTLTFLAALRVDRIDAPLLLDGPINGIKFRAYVEQALLPTLASGDVVIIDNLGSHKSNAIAQAIASVGARLLFLPPYSPDLNPIEQLFSKLKTLLRKLNARTEEQVLNAIAKVLHAFSSAECANYFRHAGYRSS
jgi:transposase